MKRALSLALSVVRGVVWALLAACLIGSLALLRCVWASRSRETLSRIDAAPRSGRFVRAGDVDLFVQEAGPADGPAVVLVHALAGWSETWRHTLDAAAARKVHAIAVDMPPLGYSERPADASYSDRSQGARLIALLDALKLKKAAVAGHSFGARAAVAAALAAPSRVSRLVIIDGALPAPGGGPKPLPAAAEWVLRTAPLRDALVAATLGNPSFTRRALAAFMADERFADEALAEVYRRPLAVEGATAAFGLLLESLTRPQPAPDYARLSMPVLLLWGEADTTTPLSFAGSLRRAMPRAALAVIPRAGHMLPFEAPAAFDAALLAFVAGKPLTGSPAKLLPSGHETHRAAGPSGPRSRR
jgi:pimeloyl-ACP methyl ester carboxylesterase